MTGAKRGRLATRVYCTLLVSIAMAFFGFRGSSLEPGEGIYAFVKSYQGSTLYE